MSVVPLLVGPLDPARQELREHPEEFEGRDDADQHR